MNLKIKKVRFVLIALLLVASPVIAGLIASQFINTSNNNSNNDTGLALLVFGYFYLVLLAISSIVIATIGTITTLIVRYRHSPKRYLYGIIGFAIPSLFLSILSIFALVFILQTSLS